MGVQSAYVRQDDLSIRRSSEVSTMPRNYAPSGVAVGSGVVCAAAAWCRTPGSYSQIRCETGTAPSAVTALQLGVWDASGAKLAETADLTAVIVAANTLYNNLPLGAPVVLAQDQLVYLGVGWVGTGFQIAAYTQRSGVMNSLPPILARNAAGYAGGPLPNLNLTTTTILPWAELIP